MWIKETRAVDFGQKLRELMRAVLCLDNFLPTEAVEGPRRFPQRARNCDLEAEFLEYVMQHKNNKWTVVFDI
jgi:hypothetical protein